MYFRTIFSIALSAVVAWATNSALASQPGTVGAVYTMTNATNAAGGNQVLVYDRLADGSLSFAEAYATGGDGSGDGLGSQGGVILSDNHRWLLVVNAGSNEISVFEVEKDGLTLMDREDSGGVRPVSVAIHGDLVYVVNAGSDSVFGLRLNQHGELEPIGDPSPLSGGDTDPAQIGFSPDGKFLLVTEKATNSIDVWPVDKEGLIGAPNVNGASGETPFAFGFGHRNQLFVSEVFGGAEGEGAVSSYALGRGGDLAVIAGSVPNHETAPCWLVVTNSGQYLFTTNTPDDSLSAYSIDFEGELELVDADGRTGEPGEGTNPLDMDLSDDGRFLYTLNIGDDTISTFRVMPDGGLDLLLDLPVAEIPAGVNGLAAR